MGGIVGGIFDWIFGDFDGGGLWINVSFFLLLVFPFQNNGFEDII